MQAKYGAPIMNNSETLYDMWPDVNYTKHFADKKFLLNLRCVPLAHEAIWALHVDGMQIEFLSARPEDKLPVTLEWMRRNRFPAVPVHLVGSFEAKMPFVQTMISQGTVPEMIIDDWGPFILQARGEGLNAMVFDQPWNRSYNVPRIRGWYNVLMRLGVTR
jgi:hypothetical protein